ncbi:MAG TPA: hypothetical protein VMV29_19925 [Ktedonobacterales bacterium]|nr:hypothetical protein [Ktedonobacterales bacterium]
MAEHADPPVVKIYPNRMIATLGAIFCLVFAIASVTTALGIGPTAAPPNSWTYQEPGRAILGVGGIALFATGTALFAFYAVTPHPILEFDSRLLSYYLFPFKYGVIQWDDIDDIQAFRQSVGHNAGKVLWLYISMSPDAKATSHFKPMKRIGVSEMFLAVTGPEVVRQMRRFHTITVLGKDWAAEQVESKH